MIADALLSLADVSKSFWVRGRESPVLAHIDLDVEDREFVAILGMSGTGKTTLLNITAGITPQDEGEVRVNGSVVTGPGPERGVIFQQYAVFPWLTVRDNITFGIKLRANRKSADERKAIVDHYLELMGLRGVEDAWPKTLSGGMKQRVAIARAYATNPQILLMDEPFGALDALTRDQMQVALQEIMDRERKTALLVTHSAEEAVFLSNRVVVLGGAPATIREIVDVPLPFPRTKEMRLLPEFSELRWYVESLL